ncbi:MAG: TPM domain-containing protein [Flavobacteriia bacterium]|nr:TPM domain-containing protein [Flavobacteriia bacterium]
MGKEHFFFTPAQESEITNAIEKAEKASSGEIRVRVETKSNGDAYKRAVYAFEKLGMTKTELRNGILFYLSTEDHQFALIGDKGIHERVGQTFWDDIRDAVISKFKEGDFTGGMVDGILKCGDALSEHFPYQEDDVNELSDDISKGEL